MSKFLTYFGVVVPNFREEKLGAGAVTIRFVLKGRIPSKKNHQQAVSRRKEAKEYLHTRLKETGHVSIADALAAVDMVQAKMRGNDRYLAFVKEFKPIIQEQMRVWEQRLGPKGLKFPIKRAALSLKLYFADRHITDTVNKQQSIQDLLIDCGVVANDDYRILNPISSSSASYYQELPENICLVSMSFKMEKTENTT